jgi:hypothetical protein
MRGAVDLQRSPSSRELWQCKVWLPEVLKSQVMSEFHDLKVTVETKHEILVYFVLSQFSHLDMCVSGRLTSRNYTHVFLHCEVCLKVLNSGFLNHMISTVSFHTGR